MANYFTDNEDLLYYFEKGIDWEPLVKSTERDSKADDAPASTEEAVALYRDMAEMVGKFVADEIAPKAAAIDAKGVHLENGEAVSPPEMDAIFEQIKSLDLHWLPIPRELGGMNCPMLLYFLNTELMARADVSVMSHYGFHSGIAMAMLIFSLREGTTKVENGEIVDTRFKEEIEEIGRGEAWGTMCITEPDAGSDMAAMRAHAEQDENGNWFLSGEKIFITSGHGKYHFVIARTEKAGDPNDPFAGLGGLSFFLVPAWEEDENGNRKRHVILDRVEEKLGHHGSCTAALTFDRAPAHLVGKRGEGFKYMLTLMNNARVGVGFESIGLCEAAYRAAKAYAAERPSMGKTIDRHEMIADYLDEMQTDIKGLRAMAMKAGLMEELGTKYSLFAEHWGDNESTQAKWVAKKAKRYQKEARRLTPLLKYLAAEKAVEISRRALQIHGGNGYMVEYGAEKLLRDALVMPIYEGTSQIQALMVMKDTLGQLMKSPQEFVKAVAQARWRSLSSRDALERRVAKLQVLSYDVQQYLIRKTATDKVRTLADKPMSTWKEAFFKQWNPKRDFAYAMLHAERLTRLLADVAICEILLDQTRRHPERAEVLRSYLNRAEPRCRYLHDEITTTGADLLARLAEQDKAAEADASAAE